MPLVDSDDAAGRAGDVVEKLFGHLNGRSKRREISGEGAPQVVKRPGLDAAVLIKRHLAFRPAGEDLLGLSTRRE